MAKKNNPAPVATSSSGLKRRSAAAAPSTQVVRKPRKMKLIKPRRLDNKTRDYSNSSLLVFPTDKHGITAGVKAAMKTAASRVRGEADIKLLKDTLEILVKHAEARHGATQERPVLARRSDRIATAAQETSSTIEVVTVEAEPEVEPELDLGPPAEKTKKKTGKK